VSWVLQGKKLYKVIVLVILISKDNSDWYKSQTHEWGQGKLVGHMKSKEEMGKNVGFLIEFIIIGCFWCECVCELNEISMKEMRKLLVPQGHALAQLCIKAGGCLIWHI
jgi:formate hydrogenlyase subunit 6/NADH:ubiquinone oxidoreductase subunit I